MLLYGPPGTGKTLTARAVANRGSLTTLRAFACVLHGSFSLAARVFGEAKHPRIAKRLHGQDYSGTDACFICVIGSELVQRYVGEGARMVRELFQLARTASTTSRPLTILLSTHPLRVLDRFFAWHGTHEGNNEASQLPERKARTKKACILFIDEVDAIGGSRGGDEGNSDSEAVL